jgi:hypothetical protein
LKKSVAALRCGTVSVGPVKPSGTGVEVVKAGSAETDWRRKRLEPLMVQGCARSAGQASCERVGRRTSVARGSQSLAGGVA